MSTTKNSRHTELVIDYSQSVTGRKLSPEKITKNSDDDECDECDENVAMTMAILMIVSVAPIMDDNSSGMYWLERLIQHSNTIQNPRVVPSPWWSSFCAGVFLGFYIRCLPNDSKPSLYTPFTQGRHQNVSPSNFLRRGFAVSHICTSNLHVCNFTEHPWRAILCDVPTNLKSNPVHV